MLYYRRYSHRLFAQDDCRRDLVHNMYTHTAGIHTARKYLQLLLSICIKQQLPLLLVLVYNQVVVMLSCWRHLNSKGRVSSLMAVLAYIRLFPRYKGMVFCPRNHLRLKSECPLYLILAVTTCDLGTENIAHRHYAKRKYSRRFIITNSRVASARMSWCIPTYNFVRLSQRPCGGVTLSLCLDCCVSFVFSYETRQHLSDVSIVVPCHAAVHCLRAQTRFRCSRRRLGLSIPQSARQ